MPESLEETSIGFLHRVAAAHRISSKVVPHAGPHFTRPQSPAASAVADAGPDPALCINCIKRSRSNRGTGYGQRFRDRWQPLFK